MPKTYLKFMPLFRAHFLRFVCGGVLCLLALAAFRLADEDPLTNVLDKIGAYNQQFPQEKAYLHTDRDAYLPGETIWLKSYLFYGESRGVDSTSGAVFVDLISPNGRRILLDTRLRQTGGFGEGYLTLPDSMATGRYTLRAYTTWMRNFSEEWFFRKTVDVISTKAPVLSAANGSMGGDQPRLDVQFLPEGGHLVAGLNSRVAVKALSPGGVGIDVEGFVLADKDTVLGFNCQHLGMGQFQLQPESGKNYTAYVRPSGTTTPYSSYTMPAPAATGYVMLVDNVGSKDNIRVYVSHNMPTAAATTPESGTSAAKLSVVAQVNGQPVHAAQASISRKSFMVPIPRAKLPEGLVQITLFDDRGKPVCERLAYSSQNERINLTVTPRKTTSGPRQRIDLDVTATDMGGKPVAANLSMAVTDTRQQPKQRPYGASLLSYLLLTSDLTGYIEQPGYYFDLANKERLLRLDLLLMTQGWRRFTWDKVLSPTQPMLLYPVDPGLTLSGTVYRGTSRVPAPNTTMTVMLTGKDSTRNVFAAVSDAQGRFQVPEAELVDTTTVFVQASQGKNRNFTVSIDRLFSPAVRLVRAPFIPFDVAYDELAEFLKRQGEYQAIEAQIRRNREIQLQAVVVKAKKIDPYARQRGMFGTPDASIKVDDINSAGAMTVFDIIRARVAGVQVTGSGQDASVQIRGAANFSGPIEPQFMIDGAPVDKSAVASMNPRDVAYIDVIKGAGAALLGSRGAGGGINVITRRGGDGNNSYVNQSVPGVRVEKVVGFALKREFYAPRYDNPTPEEKVRPDYRATLYWAPNIKTDAGGKATVSFYASDAKTTLRIHSEGTTLTGHPGMGEATMKVE